MNSGGNRPQSCLKESDRSASRLPQQVRCELEICVEAKFRGSEGGGSKMVGIKSGREDNGETEGTRARKTRRQETRRRVARRICDRVSATPTSIASFQPSLVSSAHSPIFSLSSSPVLQSSPSCLFTQCASADTVFFVGHGSGVRYMWTGRQASTGTQTIVGLRRFCSIGKYLARVTHISGSVLASRSFASSQRNVGQRAPHVVGSSASSIGEG